MPKMKEQGEWRAVIFYLCFENRDRRRCQILWRLRGRSSWGNGGPRAASRVSLVLNRQEVVLIV